MTQSGEAGETRVRPPRTTCLLVAMVCVGLFAVAIAVALVALFVWSPILVDSAVRRMQQHPAVGQKLPHLELQPLTGTDQVVTLADLEGKVAVVNFWGAWCPPCRAELPHLAELASDFQGEPRFMFLAVSCGPGGQDDLETLFEDTRAFLEEAGIDIPTYADPDTTSRQAFNSVGNFRGYPTTFLMDQGGVIRAVWVGFVPDIRNQIEELVSELLVDNE